MHESNPRVEWAPTPLIGMQLRQREKSERFEACKHYLAEGNKVPTPWLRKFSPLQDLKFIAELNELECAELNQLMPHPELWKFLQGDTEATLNQREQVAVDMHMSNGSNPPWFEVGRVVNLDDYDWQHRVRTMADQLHDSEKSRVHVSEAQHYEREMSAQASRALYKERVDTNDVTHPWRVDHCQYRIGEQSRLATV